MSPSQFAKEKLDLNCWSKMDEIFEAVAPSDGSPGHRKILVRSCNGAGKTTALAAICNWFLSTHENSIVLTTASSWMQVRRNLWGEIRRQAREAKLFPNTKLSETLIKLSDKHFMVGISPKIPENAMGFHAPHILVAVDEATGVNREIMDALFGNLSGSDSQIVLICNPINMQSYPYEAEKSGEWKLIVISAFDHPNVRDGNEEIAGAVTREWVADVLRSWSHEVEPDTAIMDKIVEVDWLGKWYRKTPMVSARILGQWADLESVGLIPMELIERNIINSGELGTIVPKRTANGELITRNQRNEDNQFSAHHSPFAVVTKRALGVDISRGVGGDSTIYAFFDVHESGCDVQLDFDKRTSDDLMATARRIREYYNSCKTDGIELIIAIDDTGIGGGVSDKLKEDNIPFFPVNFGSKAKGFFTHKQIRNARAEMYFVLHQELLEGSIKLLNDKNFHQELASVRLDVNDNSTSYKMEDKELTSRRLGRSPDYADATALARYALRLKAIEIRDKVL